jgi:hypothetical protein
VICVLRFITKGIGCCDMQRTKWHGYCPMLNMSVNHFGSCILYKSRAMLWLLPIILVLATFTCNLVNVVLSTPKTQRQQLVNWRSTEGQQSINFVGCCISYDWRAVLWHLPIINVLASFVGEREADIVTAPIWKWASTDRQRDCVLHLVSSKGCATAVIHNRRTGRLDRQYG